MVTIDEEIADALEPVKENIKDEKVPDKPDDLKTNEEEETDFQNNYEKQMEDKTEKEFFSDTEDDIVEIQLEDA